MPSSSSSKKTPGLPFKYVKDTAADEGPEIDKFFKLTEIKKREG